MLTQDEAIDICVRILPFTDQLAPVLDNELDVMCAVILNDSPLECPA